MTEWGLSGLIKLTSLVSTAVLLQLLLRPWLRRHGGAELLYASWILVPLLLLIPLFPTPGMPVPLAQVIVPLQVGLIGRAPGGTTLATSNLESTLLFIWAMGLALSLSLLLLGHARYLRKLRRSGPLWRLAAGSSAAMVGVPPRLALPIDFRTRYDALERRLVLAHERIHARRGDNAWSLLAWLLFALQWFNPLAWWALRRFRSDQELAVDATVLQLFPGRRAAYARALLKTQGHPVLALASPCSHHPLVERISMLIQPQRPLRRGVLVVLASFAMAGGYAAQMEPRAATVPAGQVRVLMDMQIEGQLFAPIVHLAPGGEEREYSIQGSNGLRYQLQVVAKPMPDKGMVLIGLTLKDSLKGVTLAAPRMAGRDGSLMRMEMRLPGEAKTLMSIDVLPRTSDWQNANAKTFDKQSAEAALKSLP